VNDLGYPVSYEALERNTPVYSSDGETIGVVDHVLADEAEDVFDGIVIASPHHHGHCFADADDVDSIHERGVTLKLTAEQSANLPKPSANPVVMRDDPSQKPYTNLERKLLRAWDRISGNY
jgi:uncharacterized protein YrrD